MFNALSGSSRLCKGSQLSGSWVAASPMLRPKRRSGGGRGPTQVPDGGREREEWGVRERPHPSENNACLPESKRQHTRTQMPAGAAPRGSRSPREGAERWGRGGAERPPSGRVVASQTAGPRGGHTRTAEGVSRGTGVLQRGEEGGRGGFLQAGRVGLREKEEKEEID